MRVVGLDLSLTSTGTAILDANGLRVGSLTPAPLTGTLRLRWIGNRVLDFTATAEIVAIEGPAYSRANAGTHELAGAWWHVRTLLDKRHVPTVVVGPGVLKRYATGRGNAPKAAVIQAAVRRLGPLLGDDEHVWTDDEADAGWLAVLGAHIVGRPTVDLPAPQRAVAEAITLTPIGDPT